MPRKNVDRDMSHKRRSERLDVLYDWTVSLDMFKTGKIKNLSKHGLFIKTSQHLEVNSIVSIEFFPPSTDEIITVKAKVVWVHTDSESNVLGIGVDFQGLRKKDKEAISYYINLIIKERDERI